MKSVHRKENSEELVVNKKSVEKELSSPISNFSIKPLQQCQLLRAVTFRKGLDTALVIGA